MDSIMGLLPIIVGTIVGAIAGFFTAKYFLTQSKAEVEQSKSAISERNLLAEHALLHVADSRKLLEDIQHQSSALQSQLDAYEELVIQARHAKDGDSFKFFGDHAMTFLRNQQKEARNHLHQTDMQPADYSAASSGLLRDGKSDTPKN